jgi:hypothetical protein
VPNENSSEGCFAVQAAALTQLLLVTVLAQTLLALVRCDLRSLALLTAWQGLTPLSRMVMS